MRGFVLVVLTVITGQSSDQTECALTALPPDDARKAGCGACHGGHGSHPVGVDYGSAAARGDGRFRLLADVVERGVYLVDGRVECVTCHDPSSRWKYHIAIPPGEMARAAVDLAQPSTYEDLSDWRKGKLPPPLPAGTAVTPTPLCMACHAIGE
ncbi:hypothetical protein [Anaeromyxobacter oryzae]|uniref:Uncharacterized protein n=1 Tax=Anaeromyxobacter oryzae TaxID=2918170 RepID=A0ABM7X0C6_9BACT|nr:hypothetical protein [Anaeromyxobacter oryzae]BDG05252.1 hypothetical protein AMOR_42480 [Anaeromyxobacter oryzae]